MNRAKSGVMIARFPLIATADRSTSPDVKKNV